jgi:hypothetical protein
MINPRNSNKDKKKNLPYDVWMNNGFGNMVFIAHLFYKFIIQSKAIFPK